MDIKPFKEPASNITFWVDKDSLWIVMLGIVVLVTGICFVLWRMFKHANQAILISSFLGTSLFFVHVWFIASTYSDKIHAEIDAYNAYVSNVEKTLEKEGFEIGSVKPHLRPGYQSNIIITHKGRNFPCNVITPTDINANVEFSCAEANLSLEEIKEKG